MVETIAIEDRTLDFTSSEQGTFRTTALLADGVEVVNALDLVVLDTEPFQPLVCEQCGTPGCSSGNRVALRRVGDGLAMIPAFDDDGAPPYFMRKRGSLLFRGKALVDLTTHMPALANLQRWPALSRRELSLLLQLEAPARVLGAFPDPPSLPRDQVIAIAYDNEAAAYDALQTHLAQPSSPASEPILVLGVGVTFYLDVPGLLDWEPLVFDGQSLHLAVARGLGIAFVQRAGE